jgi:hypothetical protein
MGGSSRISRAEPLMTGGTLAARSSLTRAKRKLEQNPTPAQRGAVTRAKKYAARSYDRNTQPRKFGRPASVMRKRPPERPAWWGVKGGGGKAGEEKKRSAVMAKMSLQRSGVIRKPKGLKPGAITERIMNKDRAIIASSYKRIERAQQRRRKLNSIQREIDYRRSNPVGGRAARGQLTKRLNKQQKKLNNSMDKVFSAIELSYKPRISAAENRLRQMTVAKTSTSGLRTSRRGAVLQRSIFGGATATYR